MSVKSPFDGRVQHPDAIQYLNFLIYGDPGVGKTYLCGTAQNHKLTKPILFLDVEGGTVTLRHQKDIDVIQLRDLKQIEEVHKNLRENNDGYYKTVIIDSLSELADLDMREVMRKMLQARPDRDPDIADKREWGIVRTHMRRIVRAFKDLPVHTIMTALLIKEKDDTTGAVTYYPQLSGKLKSEVPGFFDVVGFMSTDVKGSGENIEILRKIQFQKSNKVVAKDRTNSFGALLTNTSIPEMIDMMKIGDNHK